MSRDSLHILDMRNIEKIDLSGIGDNESITHVIVDDMEIFKENCESNYESFKYITSTLEIESISCILFTVYDVKTVKVFDLEGRIILDSDGLFKEKIRWLNSKICVNDFISNFDLYIGSVKEADIPDEIKWLLLRNLNSLQNLSNLDLRLMLKDSFLSESDTLLRKNDTCFDNIMLKEFEAGAHHYTNMLEAKIYLSKTLKSRKTDFFKVISDFVPRDPSSIKKSDGYPIVYKLYSAYLFQCAKLKRSLGAISSSFMFYFRALEAYVDGFLVTLEIAEIRDLFNKSGELKKSNVFLVKGQFKSGFGGKWNELKKELTNEDLIEEISDDYLNYISDLISLRNNFIMTHGDVKVTDSILGGVEFNLVNLINSLEDSINQQKTKWKSLVEYFDDFCQLEPGKEFERFIGDEMLFKLYA